MRAIYIERKKGKRKVGERVKKKGKEGEKEGEEREERDYHA